MDGSRSLPDVDSTEPCLVSIPRVATSRLLLREFRPSDFEGFAQDLADPLAGTFIPRTADRRMAFRLFSSASGSWVLDGKGWWAVTLRETAEVVGSVGGFVRAVAPDLLPGSVAPDLELGWKVYRPFWGRGYATEAARAVLDFAIERHLPPRVVAHVDEGNRASIRVAQKLGMVFEGDVDFYGERIGRYALAR